MHPFAIQSPPATPDLPRAGVRGIRIPLPVIICLLVDVTLAATHLAMEVVIRAGWMADTDLFHLGREQNIPTWYSSTKLAGVALALFCTAYLLKSARRLDRVAVFLGAAMFAVLSIDEAAMLHERLGDLVNTDGIRSRFNESGIWPLLCAPAFVLGLVIVYRMARRLLTPDVTVLLATGLVLLLGGAVGLELAANLVTPYSLIYHGLVLAEETLEMLGASVLLFGAIRFARAHGVRISNAQDSD